ncbi:MAG: DMT family transporter [Hyphomicrobiales bacterium]|nr:DMT family transporter [Hyphomicrobiales bacterium]MCP4999036.1 DMT family transporter [Hyphomicrobiales bacterium]
MLAYAVFVAGSFSFGALAVPHIGAAPLTAARFLLAAILMGLLLIVLSGRAPSVPKSPWRYVILGSLMGIFFVLMFVALDITDPVSTSAVFTLIPLMSAGFAYVLLRQISGRIAMVSLVISAIGALWVIFRGDLERALTFDVGKGEAIFFVGCVCQAAYGPLVRLFNRGESVLEFTFWTLVAATLCLTVFALPELMETEWTALPAIVWYCLGYLTVFATATSFFLLQFASLRLPAGKVFAYGYLVPSFVIVLEGASGQGWVSPIVAIGALITVTGLVVLVFAPER